jgi:hypothetical protein
VDNASGRAVKLWAARDQGRRRSRGQSIGNAARARRGRLGARAQEVFGRWANWAGTVAVGQAQFQGLNIFSNTSTTPNLKNTKVVSLILQIFQTLPSSR